MHNKIYLGIAITAILFGLAAASSTTSNQLYSNTTNHTSTNTIAITPAPTVTATCYTNSSRSSKTGKVIAGEKPIYCAAQTTGFSNSSNVTYAWSCNTNCGGSGGLALSCTGSSCLLSAPLNMSNPYSVVVVNATQGSLKASYSLGIIVSPRLTLTVACFTQAGGITAKVNAGWPPITCYAEGNGGTGSYNSYTWSCKTNCGNSTGIVISGVGATCIGLSCYVSAPTTAVPSNALVLVSLKDTGGATASYLLNLMVVQAGPSPSRTSGIPILARPMYNQTLLGFAEGQVNCKTNFTKSFESQIVQLIPNASSQLGPQIATLGQDTAQLQTYANSGEMSTFKGYVQGAYDSELMTINKMFVPAIMASKPTNATIHQLLSEYNATKASYESCSFSGIKADALQVVQIYQNQIAMYNQQIAGLSKYGVNTAQMSSDISGANATILVPLQNAINSAQNTSQIQSALQSYCLFDECSGGTNYHLAAKFSADKLTAILNLAETLNSTKNQQANLSQVQSNINSAKAMIQQAGSSEYTSSQETQIFSYLQQAGSQLKAILQK